MVTHKALCLGHTTRLSELSDRCTVQASQLPVLYSGVLLSWLPHYMADQRQGVTRYMITQTRLDTD